MVSSFTLRTEELNANFIETIKNLFADREIEIIVQDVQTDTDYLLKARKTENTCCSQSQT